MTEKDNKTLVKKALFLLERTTWKFKNTTLRKVIESVVIGNEKVYFDSNKKYKFKQLEESEYCKQASPFILIKPSGIPRLNNIKQVLLKNNIKVLKEHNIDDYRSLAMQLFGQADKSELLSWFQILEACYPKEECNKAKVLEVSEADMENVARVKRKIRKIVGVDFFDVNVDGKWQETSLTPLHSPDPERLEKEFNICMQYVKDTKVSETTSLERI